MSSERLTGREAAPKVQYWLLGLAILGVVAGGWGALYPQNSWLQLGPCLLLLLAGPAILRRYPVSTGAVLNIVLFLLLHAVAARWSYSFVPYDAAIHAFTGWSPDAAFGFERNMFDRLVHFAFGLLAIRPVREVAIRHFGLSARAALYVALEFVLAISAFYEIFEWLLALSLAPGDADAYNGQQGDMFDAQKDMAMAASGALVALAAIWGRSLAGR